MVAVIEPALDTGALERAIAAIDPSLPFEVSVHEAVRILQRRGVDIWRLFSSVGTRPPANAPPPPAHTDPPLPLFGRSPAPPTVEPILAARPGPAFPPLPAH